MHKIINWSLFDKIYIVSEIVSGLLLESGAPNAT